MRREERASEMTAVKRERKRMRERSATAIREQREKRENETKSKSNRMFGSIITKIGSALGYLLSTQFFFQQ